MLAKCTNPLAPLRFVISIVEGCSNSKLSRL